MFVIRRNVGEFFLLVGDIKVVAAKKCHPSAKLLPPVTQTEAVC
jgi:hypothetical protein